MQIDRSRTPSRNVEIVADQLSTIQGPCVGCTDCVGLCKSLIEALTLPDIILTKRR